MDGANLSNAQLYQADFTGASMKRAVVVGANIGDATVDKGALSETLRAPPPIFYIDDQPLNQVLQAHERWCDSAGVEGVAARLGEVDFRPLRSLAERQLTALVAPNSIFFGLNMKAVQLQGSDLSGADLRSTDLRGADLRGAKLRDAQLTRADLRGAKLGPLPITEGRVVRTDLSRAVLRQADLRAADLRRARMLDADLSGAKLEGAGLEGAEFEA
jgi:uncharacterized protein YjbI with pentapeptide repeats